jgi:PAS domain S-box-containing protein
MNETAWVIDFNGNFVEVNNTAAKTLGYSKKELLTMGLKDIDKAFNQEEFENHVRSMPAVGTKVFERVHTAKDGTEIPVEISSSLITYHGQQTTLSIARNITERKKAEEALKESETKYRTLVETTDDVVLLTDLEGRHIFRNKAYYTSLGYEVEEEPSLNGYEKVHPDDVPNLKAKMTELLKLGSITSEYRVRHKNGNWIYRFTKSTVIYNQAHEPTSIIAIIRDITERKKAEQTLKKSEQRYRELVNSMAEMYHIVELIHDEKGKPIDFSYLEVNIGFEKFFGKTREQIVGKRAKEFGTVGDAWLDALDKVAKTGQPLHYENWPTINYGNFKSSIWKVGENQVAVLCMDVTGREKSEQVQRENRNF